MNDFTGVVFQMTKKQAVLSLLVASLVCFSAGCGGGGSSSSTPPSTPTPTPTPAAATPVFSPAGGTYSATQSVTITDATPGAAIYYTTDGSTPTASSALYTAAIQVSATVTIRAIAVASGYANSAVTTATYTIVPLAATSYTWNNVQIVAGGFADGIVFHPRQQDLVYARTDIGGAYRWDPATSTWTPLLDWIGTSRSNYIGVESIGLDPADPDRLYLAVGTYAESWGGNGAILVSTDRGDTFQTVPMSIKMGANDNGRFAGERLAVDPNLGSIVYFGSRNNGLWKSTDYGAHWSQVSSFPVASGGVGVIFIDFIQASGVSGSATPVIYAGVSSTGTGLYRSTDAGQSWQAVPDQPTGLYPNHGPLGPDGNIYISYGNNVGPNDITSGAVWRYTPPPSGNPSGSGTWTNITPPAPSYPNTGSYGYGCVAVDAEQPGTIMVSTLDLWWQHDDIFRSLNGGSTWEELGASGTWDSSLSPWVGKLQASTSPGWWMGSLAIDPFNSGHVLYGTGATIWSTSSATRADTNQPVNWTIGAKGIEETAVLQLISPPSGPANLLSGVGDIGGFTHLDLNQTPAAGMMSNPIFSNTTGLDFAQSAPLVIARTGINSGGQFGAYSTDGGLTWTPFPALPAGTTGGAGSIGVSADGATFVWAPSDAPPAYSTNRGASWTASGGIPAGYHPTVVADRVNPRKFYLYSSSGGALYVSTDGGATFSAAASLTGSGNLTASFAAEGDLWLASTGGLYHSTNSGGAFAAVPGVQLGYSIGFGRAASGATYPALYLYGEIGNVVAFFRSTDEGATWVRINDDRHQYGNASIVIGDPRVFGRVYIGTGGRGVIYGDPAVAGSAVTAGSQALPPARRLIAGQKQNE
jgi:hypothetical protein